MPGNQSGCGQFFIIVAGVFVGLVLFAFVG